MRKLFLFLFIIFVATSLSAKNKITIKMRVNAYKGSSAGIRIELYCNSKKERSLKVNNVGKCDVHLLFNKDYRLAVVKKGYVTKYIDINTDVPAEILDYDSDFPPEKLKVTIYPKRKNVDISIFKQPVEKLLYDKQLDDIVFDKEYANLIKDKIQNVENLLKMGNKAREEIASPEVAAKESELKNKALAEKLKTKTPPKTVVNKEINKQPSKKKIDKIKAVSVVGMIGNMRVIADANDREKKSTNVALPKQLNKTKNKKVKIDTLSSEQDTDVQIEIPEIKDTSINIIDSLVTPTPVNNEVVTIEQAVITNKQHTKTKTNNKDKLSEKDRLKLENDYKTLITRGDKAFNTANYAIAKYYYSQAKQLKKEEKYPSNKIAQINAILEKTKQKKLEKQYREIVNKADGYFKKNSYVVARFYYNRAHEIRSWDKHVNKRLKEIERKIGK